MTPTVRMYPGEVRRWRILNAAEGKFASLSLEGHDLQALAWDGLCLDAPEPNEFVAMSGGNRVETLVKAAAPGTYRLVLTPGSSQHPEIPGIPHPDDIPHPQTAELSPRTVLTLIVEGEGPEMDLPATLPVYDPPMPRIRRRRRVGYTVERDTDGDTFLDFSINGKPFSPDQKPYRVKLGTAEEWRILNAADTKYPQHAHAFHIHVNPFKVIEINGQRLKKPLWRDTFALSGTDGDSFVMQTHFEDFTGRFVEHCHVLTHEDLGMMEIIEVVP